MTHLDPEALEAVAAEPSRASPADQAHLAGCPACRARLRDAAGRWALLRGLRPVTLSDAAFRRVEARVLEVASAPPPSWAWRWVVVAVGVAVLGVGLGAVLPRRAVAPAAPPSAEQRPRLRPARVEPLTVLLASGEARLQAAGAAESLPLSAGQVVGPGARVSGRAVRLAPVAPEVRWAFELAGAAVVGAGASLALTEGELGARVSRSELDVAVGGLHALAVESAFVLERSAAELVVEVSEGSVELVDAAFARREVRAPARVRFPDGAPLSAAVLEAPRGGRAVAEAPARPWVPLDAAGLPGGARLVLDGALLGEAPFTALASQGRHRLGVAPPGEATRETWVELTGPYSVRLPAEPVAARPTPAPDPSAIQAALERQRPKLAACYEKWLKANPAAAAEVELKLSVSASGQVREATLVGELAKEPAACLLRTARGLTLPPLGADLELELPLRLKAQRE